MRFISNGPIIPDHLLNERDAGRVVFLCGAGVSIPAGMPSFVCLTAQVITTLAPPKDSDVVIAFQPWKDDKGSTSARTPLDQIFNMLQNTYGRDNVNKIVTEFLTISDKTHACSDKHEIISKISSDQEGHPQIVTTNFDRLFELTTSGSTLSCFIPPTFPDLRHDVSIVGITYLHGRLAEVSATTKPDYVLSSADFGRAYLAQGWATTFIRYLLKKYTVVLLGYQAEDPPVKYLLQGLNIGSKEFQNKLYAFDRGLPDRIEAKWRGMGVTPIAYGGDNHDTLWDTLKAWAERSDDPRAWQQSIAKMAQKSPRELEPHERGMVCHLVRSTQGAKLFAAANPVPPIEWLCVFDRLCRVAQPSSEHGEGAKTFDPMQHYGLDDDLSRQEDNGELSHTIPEDIISWQYGDNTPSEVFRLATGTVEGFEPLPNRLGYLAKWIVGNISDPVLAWWAARQCKLYPRLHSWLVWAIADNDELNDIARQTWYAILEYLERGDPNSFDLEWEQVMQQINTSGWPARVLRAFEQVTEPTFKVGSASGLASSRPPMKQWKDVKQSEIACIDVEFPSQDWELVDIPDCALPAVYAAIQRNLVRATERLNEIDSKFYSRIKLYGGDEPITDQYINDRDAYVLWFVVLLKRMAKLHPELLKAHVATWPPDEPIFDKLWLYILRPELVFTSDEVTRHLLDLDQKIFWNLEHRSEILPLLRDHWPHFSSQNIDEIIAHILAEKDDSLRVFSSIVQIGWLKREGCTIPEPALQKWQILKESCPNCNDDYIETAVETNSPQATFIRRDENTKVFDRIPVNKIIQVAKERDGYSLLESVEYSHFTGLVKQQPSRALSAIGVAFRHGEYPEKFWKALIYYWPNAAPKRATFLLLERMRRLPHEQFLYLQNEICNFLTDHWPDLAACNEAYALGIFDDLINGLCSTDQSVSGLDEVIINRETVEVSRRTVAHAIVSPIGQATEALITALKSRNLPKDSGIPIEFLSRFGRLIALPDEGSDYVICLLAQQINWLNHIAPQWVADQMIPWFNLDNPASEPAWNGVLCANSCPSLELFAQMKPSFLQLFKSDTPPLYGWQWNDGEEKRAHHWVVFTATCAYQDVPGITFNEARDCIRTMTSTGRMHVIQALRRVGQKNDDGWTRFVIPFITKAWPNEIIFQTEKTTRAWVFLLHQTKSDFPLVLSAVKKYLRPIKTSNYSLYKFTETSGNNISIATTYPKETLELLAQIIAENASDTPYGLDKVLDQIIETDSTILGDQQYTRLQKLAASL